LGYPKGLAHEETETRRGGEPRGIRGGGLNRQIVGKRPFGSFHYGKLVGKEAILCEVRVFLLRVEQQLDDWPEKRWRETKWFEASEAAGLVYEGGLAEIIDRFSRSYIRFPAFS
jgi:hypothetical protein